MIRQLLALILISTTVSTASFAQTSDPVKPVLVDRSSYHPEDKAIKLVRRENKLRRGKDAEFAVMLSTSSPNCGECLPTQLEEGEQPVFISLQIDPSRGFSYRYPDSQNGKFKQTAKGKLIRTKAGSAALVKIHADKNLPLGTYTLNGKVQIRVFQKGKPPEDKQINVAIPIELVDQHALAAATSWPYEIPPNHNVRDGLRALIMVPLYLPLILVLIVYCSFSNCSD
jgi:hypothetical protein